jgi:hypothetical protein
VDYFTNGTIELFATPDYKIYGFICDGAAFPQDIPPNIVQGSKLSTGKVVQFVDEFFNETEFTYREGELQ